MDVPALVVERVGACGVRGERCISGFLWRSSVLSDLLVIFNVRFSCAGTFFTTRAVLVLCNAAWMSGRTSAS